MPVKHINTDKKNTFFKNRIIKNLHKVTMINFVFIKLYYKNKNLTMSIGQH